MSHVLGIRYPGNGSTMLVSVGDYNELAYQDRVDIRSSDERFGCNAISSIFFNRGDAVLADTRKVLDTLLVEVRQGCKVGNVFVSNTKHRSV